MIQHNTEREYHSRRNKIRIQHSQKTYSARQYGYNFGVVCHFRSEKDNCNKHKQGTERVCIEWDHRQIKVEDNLSQRRFFSDKIVDMFAYVENNYYHDDKGQNQQKCPDEFPYYICIYFFHIFTFIRPA
jgi:hypothetical protein